MTSLDPLRLDLSRRVKNGLAFILAAIIIWLAVTYVWTLDYTPYSKSVLTFIVGGPMLPLAYGMTKLIKAEWKINDNPLDPLGMWLNFAQLFYFPFLFFTLGRHPEDFVMVYAIITGAHFFPYSWFYKTPAFAVMAGVISVGAMILRLNTTLAQTYLIPLFMAASLAVLALWIHVDYRQKIMRPIAEPLTSTT